MKPSADGIETWVQAFRPMPPLAVALHAACCYFHFWALLCFKVLVLLLLLCLFVVYFFDTYVLTLVCHYVLSLLQDNMPALKKYMEETVPSKDCWEVRQRE